MANTLARLVAAKVPAVTSETQKLCDETRDRIRQHEQTTILKVAEIGALLIRVKVTLGHGGFKKWIDAEVRWTIRTAENYMNVAKNIGGKCETVSNLPLRTVYKLASQSVSKEYRQQIIATITDPLNPPARAIEESLSALRPRRGVKRAKPADVEAPMMAGATIAEESGEYGRKQAKDRLTQQAVEWLEQLGDKAADVLACLAGIGVTALINMAEKNPELIARGKTITRKPQEIELKPTEYHQASAVQVTDEELTELDLSHVEAA